MRRVVVVGGGVLGLMHAVAAVRRGHQVIHLEREAGSRGASVRNFGLVWVSGRAPGPELALALRSRYLWEELAGVVPDAGFRTHGSLTLASDEAEADLLREAAGLPDANLRGYLESGSAPGGYAWLPNREAVDVGPAAVRDHTGTWHRGDLPRRSRPRPSTCGRPRTRRGRRTLNDSDQRGVPGHGGDHGSG